MDTDVFRADGTSRKVIIGGGARDVHIGFSGGFGGGTVTIEKVVAGVVSDLLDGATALTFTAADDNTYLLKYGDIIQFTLSGSTNPTLRWAVTGN